MESIIFPYSKLYGTAVEDVEVVVVGTEPFMLAVWPSWSVMVPLRGSS